MCGLLIKNNAKNRKTMSFFRTMLFLWYIIFLFSKQINSLFKFYNV